MWENEKMNVDFRDREAKKIDKIWVSIFSFNLNECIDRIWGSNVEEALRTWHVKKKKKI